MAVQAAVGGVLAVSVIMNIVLVIIVVVLLIRGKDRFRGVHSLSLKLILTAVHVCLGYIPALVRPQGIATKSNEHTSIWSLSTKSANYKVDDDR